MFFGNSKQAGNCRRETILLALEDRFGLSRVPVLLYRSGCRVTVIGDPNAPVAASRFVERIIPCKLDPSSAAKALCRVMESHHGKMPWVVFGDEIALQAGLLCKDQPWLKQVFPVDPTSGAEVIFRKAAFMAAATAAGIPVPPMRVCSSRSEAIAAAGQLKFPLFLKRDLDCAGAGIMKIMRPADVAPAFETLSDTGNVVIQQMIHGRVGKTNALYNRGRLMCHSSAYARKTWPGPFGPSCVREYFCDRELEKIAAAIGAMTGFHGLCGFDWIHDRDTGRFIAIEFNGRPIATFHLGKYVGVDYERAVRDFLAGRFTVQRPRMTTRERPIIYMFPQDVRRCISDHDLPGLGRWLFTDITTDTPWNDASIILHCVVSWLRLTSRRVRRSLNGRRRVWTVQPLGQSVPEERETNHVMA